MFSQHLSLKLLEYKCMNALRFNIHISTHSVLEPLEDPFYTSLPVDLIVDLIFPDNSLDPQVDIQNL